MLVDIHTGSSALHMLACCPHNLYAIWQGTSQSPYTPGSLVFLSHGAGETSVCVCDIPQKHKRVNTCED